MTPPDQPSGRKPAGIFIILLLIIVWVWAVTTVMEWAAPVPTWAQVVIYGIVGIVWIAPLRPVLLWMETGKWRE